MHKKLAAAIPVTKYERHMPVCPGHLDEERMWSNASENTMQSAWTLKEMKDAVLRGVSA
jgi:hypothetical protein